jgi:hypothetical protein
MKCPSCHKTIKKNDKKCKFCGKKFETEKKKKEERIVYRTVESNNKWLIVLTILMAIFMLIQSSFMIWYIVKKDNNNVMNVKVIEKEQIPIPSVDTIPIYNYLLGESFVFDGFNITIHDKYSIVKIDNKYSTYNGKEVIKLPVTIKNITDKSNSFNIYKYKIFGPNMNELDEVAQYFDEGLFYTKDLKPNEEKTKYLYFLFDYNGKYLVRFEDENSIKNIVLNVYK